MTTTVAVGPFRVADLNYSEAIRRAASLAENPTSLQRFYALHVGGLNARHDAEFVEEMNDAELVCADGGSIVLLGRLAGGRGIERVPTTDAGWDVLAEVGRLFGRLPRVALLGGHQNIVRAAADTLSKAGAAEVVYVGHGYHQAWDNVTAALRESRPDILVLGMGAPREMLWVKRHKDDLPICLVVTCGGWFGFLAGEESRAPRILRRSGLEWIARVAQAPARLLPRYIRGMYSVIVVGMGLAWGRLHGR